jgi:hypothetical protein
VLSGPGWPCAGQPLRLSLSRMPGQGSRAAAGLARPGHDFDDSDGPARPVKGRARHPSRNPVAARDGSRGTGPGPGQAQGTECAASCCDARALARGPGRQQESKTRNSAGQGWQGRSRGADQRPRPPRGALLFGAPRPAPRARGARFLAPRAPGAPAPLPTLARGTPASSGSARGCRRIEACALTRRTCRRVLAQIVLPIVS